ncbi:MAG: ATP-binding cassette, subfamily bacterial PglK [Thermoplasmata archaeon]|jgi:ABC-type multidrug transport system fused ATPase/permease subunit|nr:ATP-binding cassette, subfamily bacterial PglK [Thermoplasmata archaeon]
MMKLRTMRKASAALRPAWRFSGIVAYSMVGSLFDAASVFLVYILGSTLSGGRLPSSGFIARVLDVMQGIADRVGTEFNVVLSLAFLLCVLLRGANRFAVTQLVAHVQFDLHREYTQRLVKGYFGLSYETFLQRNSVERINSIGQEAPRAGVFVASAIRVVGNGLNLLLLIVLLLLVDWHAFVFAAVVGVILFLVSGPLSRRSRMAGQRINAATRELWFSVIEAFRAYRVIVTNQAVGSVERDVMQKYQRQYDIQKHYSITQQLVSPVLETTAGVIIVLAVLASLRFTSGPEEAFPMVILVMASTYRILPAITNMNQASTLVLFNEPGFDFIQAELQQVEREHDPPGTRHFPPVRRQDHLLELDGVAFRYREGREVLRGVSLSLARGERIGIVGTSGSGKSTLVDLCLGLLRPAAGELRMGRRTDGSPLTVTYLPQQSILLDATVLQNVALGEPGSAADPARAQRALDEVGLGAGSGHPLALDAPLGEGGVRLSGGQRQRLGLARCLYRGADLLILDEPTAALDAESEAGLVATLGAIPGLTLLVVTHRQAPLRICSRVFRLGKGELHPESPRAAAAMADEDEMAEQDEQAGQGRTGAVDAGAGPLA